MIETERLFIRPWQLDDLDSLRGLSKDVGYLNFASPGFLQFASDDEARAYLKRRAGLFQEKKLGKFPLFLKSNQQCIGTCGFDPYRIHERDELELGYRITLKNWNRGFATEAARALVDYAFDSLGREQIFAFAIEQNRGSVRVIEKLGFASRGTLMHAEYEHLLFEKRRDES